VEQQREKEGREVERGVDPKKRFYVYHCSSCKTYSVEKDAKFCKHCGDTLNKL
jgi:rRNA maturation endonuclease Nob1